MSINFAELTASDSDAPIKRNVSSSILQTPIPGWLKETHANGHTKVVTVANADQVKELVHAVRAAGRAVGLGVRISVEGTTVRFQGKTKQQREPMSEEVKAERARKRAANKAAKEAGEAAPKPGPRKR